MARTKEDKAAFIQSLRDAAKALEDSGIEVPSTLLSSYSLHNCMVILSQRPSATHCAGFHAWKDAGRMVRKGAKGIAIMVPIGAREDDTPIFSWRYVFDIVDTDILTDDAPKLARELVNA